jgi:hypothetical protein
MCLHYVLLCKYINKARQKRRSSKKVVDFYNGLVGKVKGFRGFIMTGSLDDPQKAVMYHYGNQEKIWITTMQMIRSTHHF